MNSHPSEDSEPEERPQIQAGLCLEDHASGELSSSPFPADAKLFDKKIIFASLRGVGKKVDNLISALPDANMPIKMDTFAGDKCNISKEDGSTKKL